MTNRLSLKIFVTNTVNNHKPKLNILIGCLLLLGGLFQAHAEDVQVVGLFPGKAVLIVNGGTPKTYSVGQKINDNIQLSGVSDNSASFLINGKRTNLPLGQSYGTVSASGERKAVLQADTRGHFITQAQINGVSVRVIVDTGASAVALPASDVQRMGVDYKKGSIGFSNTANGIKPVYRITLDTVKVGDILMHQVDASVHESGLDIGLLGMSFLNRTEMRREGDQMTLIKRF